MSTPFFPPDDLELGLPSGVPDLPVPDPAGPGAGGPASLPRTGPEGEPLGFPAPSPSRGTLVAGRQRRRLRSAPALCLSGGGYRATLFHAGALWRLADGGLLSRVGLVSCVSGGAIAGAALALAWSRVVADAAAFEDAVVEPLRRLAGRTIDVPAALWGAMLPGGPGARLARAYDRWVCDGATLQDLPDRPHFAFLATSLQSGELWRFGKPYMTDGKIGRVERPEVPLALAVAASSAFPPFLAPLRLRLDPLRVRAPEGDAPRGGPRRPLRARPYTERVVLADGGVYDNLGLEPAWRGHRTLLVSDAGGAFEPEPRPAAAWGRLTLRVLGAIDNQVRALRRRELVAALGARTRAGAYWSIRRPLTTWGAGAVPGALPCPPHRTRQLADLPTRLARTPAATQERLVNWGYAACDAAVRRAYAAEVAAPASFPYPSAGV